MTTRRQHLASAVPVAVLTVAVGFSPVVVVPLFAGVLLPDLDALSERTHRSWLLHTFLAQTLAYQLAIVAGIPPDGQLVELLHFVSLGVALHLLADYIYPHGRDHKGAEWPVRPTVGSAPWGLVFLGVSWLLQWFGYLANTFIPWLVPG